MTAIVGSGEYIYRVEENWQKLPDGWNLSDVAGVAVDRQDRVYVFNRGPHPMIVFDRDGNFIKAWGEGIFSHPHAVQVAPDDTLYCVDDMDHTVRKCTFDGKILLEIGLPGKPAPAFSGRPFCGCTHTALSPTGDLYVSDGYGNARVHKFSPDGSLIMSWGESGTGPGQFNLVHNICCDRDGWVYVADRENHRIQVFGGDGRYETQWNNLHRPCALYLDEAHGAPVFYVGELGPVMETNITYPNLGPRLSIMAGKDELLTRFGGQHAGTGLCDFIAPHAIAVDSRGDLYVGEVSYIEWPLVFPKTPKPTYIRSLRKLTKVNAKSG